MKAMIGDIECIDGEYVRIHLTPNTVVVDLDYDDPWLAEVEAERIMIKTGAAGYIIPDTCTMPFVYTGGRD